MEAPLSAEEQLRIIDALLAQETFDEIADSLAEIIQRLHRLMVDVGIREVIDDLRGRRGQFGKQDLDKALAILDDALSGQFPDNVAPIMRDASRVLYVRGQDEIRAGLSASLNLTDRRAVRWLHEHHMYWLRTRFDKDTTDRIKRLADTAMKNGLSRRDATTFFKNTIGKAINEDDWYWEVVADAITTRARSFGSIEGMVKADIHEYRIDAVIDHRTSDICKYLDGQPVEIEDENGEKQTVQLTDKDRTFDVRNAMRLRDRMIEAKTPEEAKDIMPWRSPKSVVGKFPADLSRMGVMMPPFHGRCRSRLVMV